MLELEPTEAAVAIGASLTVVSILLTMLWTIREMYAHESRFAGVAMLEAVADWSVARTDRERRVAIARAKEWLRVCEEFMDHAGRRSRPALFLMVTALLLAAALCVVALSKDFAGWQESTVSLTAAAAVTFIFAALAVYDIHGYVGIRPLRDAIRFSSKGLAFIFPFLAVPLPHRWPEIALLVESIPELRSYDRDVYRTELVTADLLALAREPRDESPIARVVRAMLTVFGR